MGLSETSWVTVGKSSNLLSFSNWLSLKGTKIVSEISSNSRVLCSTVMSRANTEKFVRLEENWTYENLPMVKILYQLKSFLLSKNKKFKTRLDTHTESQYS